MFLLQAALWLCGCCTFQELKANPVAVTVLFMFGNKLDTENGFALRTPVCHWLRQVIP